MPQVEHTPIMAQIDALPPLPESVRELERLFAQGDPAPKEVVAVIEKDPALTVDILSATNNAYYGFRTEVVSVQQAVMLLGPVRIRGMALKFAAERLFDVDLSPYGIHTGQFADLCRVQSDLAFYWLMGEDLSRARILVPLAFLMETGKIIIANEIIRQDLQEDFREDLQRFARIEDAEIVHAGLTTAQVDALLFQRWNLPEEFVQIMSWLDKESEEGPPAEIEKEVAAMAAIRAAVNVRGVLEEEGIEQAYAIAGRHGLAEERLLHAAKQLKTRLADQP